MAKQYSFSITSPPLFVIARHLVQDEDFVEDCRLILGMEEDSFKKLTATLAEAQPFLHRDALNAATNAVLGAGERSRNVARILWRLNEILRDAEEPFERALPVLKKAILDGCEALQQPERDTLATRLEELVAEPQGFARQFKAQRLARATGAQLEDVQIICDIRPVFNEKRSDIDGAIPISVLRLDITEFDGTARSIEVQLTEEEISDLCVKAETAKTKISVIKGLLASKSITMPVTSVTTEDRQGE